MNQCKKIKVSPSTPTVACDVGQERPQEIGKVVWTEKIERSIYSFGTEICWKGIQPFETKIN